VQKHQAYYLYYGYGCYCCYGFDHDFGHGFDHDFGFVISALDCGIFVLDLGLFLVTIVPFVQQKCPKYFWHVQF
jgi:hypothetical protein